MLFIEEQCGPSGSALRLYNKCQAISYTARTCEIKEIEEIMEVLRPFPISLILLPVFIFLCTVGQLYSAIAIPSASSSYDLPVSASSSNGNNNYIVFLYHHRPDVGNTFASYLSRSLISRGLRIGTIETASVYIAIFSKDYAKSSSCLNELLIILKSGTPIIPVFYDVEPSDLQCHVMYAPVRRMSRSTSVKNGVLYGEELRMLEEEKTFDPNILEERPQYDSNTITEWGKALFDASGICGFELAAYNG